MTIQQRLEILKKYPLFNNLGEKELQILAEKAVEKSFPTHSIILSQGQLAKEVLLIHKGLVKIYIANEDGKNIPIRTMGPFYLIGEVNIFDEEKTATIETIQETQAFAFSFNEIKRLLLNYPTFGYNLLKIVVEKLHAANKQTEYYFSTSLKDRTWTMIQAIANHFPNKDIPFSQEEIADMVGATRAKVTEALQELQNDHLISIQYKKIHVL